MANNSVCLQLWPVRHPAISGRSDGWSLTYNLTKIYGLNYVNQPKITKSYFNIINDFLPLVEVS